ncbi:DUF192 domain-containing protein [Robertkochia solimangrovi]|uniref:DUF192 domain-containing protein n=1 Tax=Robertkochia solimangrovi TaxID=2213046 RepID=UPI00117E93ED|nr:DUF192 domain-containing protein [Robertkochia solimangrovi]TRZ42736.1 DUF192 domain-containing protein [Robertkochia solimangrovi]
MKHRSVLLSSIALFTLVILSSCKDPSGSKDTIKTVAIKFKAEDTITIIRNDTLTIAQIMVEIADDDYERETGLMYRNSMEPDQGMLFVMDDESLQYFHMKNTHIGLDLIFADSNRKVVHIIHDAKPMDETTLPSTKPAKYVLEINAGQADTRNIQTGDFLQFSYK